MRTKEERQMAQLSLAEKLLLALNPSPEMDSRNEMWKTVDTAYYVLKWSWHFKDVFQLGWPTFLVHVPNLFVPIPGGINKAARTCGTYPVHLSHLITKERSNREQIPITWCQWHQLWKSVWEKRLSKIETEMQTLLEVVFFIYIYIYFYFFPKG